MITAATVWVLLLVGTQNTNLHFSNKPSCEQTLKNINLKVLGRNSGTMGYCIPANNLTTP